MIRRGVALLVGVAATLTCGGAQAATDDPHHFWHDSVHHGAIHYASATRYDDAVAHAVGQWNALGATDLKPATGASHVDLEIVDVNDPDVTWAAYYTWYPFGPDTIELNSFFLDRHGPTYKRAVVTHEIGHAYGIADHRRDAYADTVMYWKTNQVSALQPHDVADWREKWD